jgi:hypothetical protein
MVPAELESHFATCTEYVRSFEGIWRSLVRMVDDYEISPSKENNGDLAFHTYGKGLLGNLSVFAHDLTGSASTILGPLTLSP